MTGHAYATSARTAARMGPFAGYAENARAHAQGAAHAPRRGGRRSTRSWSRPSCCRAAQQAWDDACRARRAVRRAQLAGHRCWRPPAPSACMMDCDTTGIEPDLGLVQDQEAGRRRHHVDRQPDGAAGAAPPRLHRRPDRRHRRLHRRAQVDPRRARTSPPSTCRCSPARWATTPSTTSGHVRMMGAVQPFISGAISKTVNMPEEVTVEDVEQLHIDAWQLGLKAVAIYRDNCKVAQPLSTAKKDGAGRRRRPPPRPRPPVRRSSSAIVEKIVTRAGPREAAPHPHVAARSSSGWPTARASSPSASTTTAGPGEIFLQVSKQGSTLAGIMDAFAISVSHGLQYGVPLRAFVETFTNMRFEPAGMTDDPDIRFASLADRLHLPPPGGRLPAASRSGPSSASSPSASACSPRCPASRRRSSRPSGPRHRRRPAVDRVGRRARAARPSSSDRPSRCSTAGVTDPPGEPARRSSRTCSHADAPYCMQCGVQMQRAGSCHACPSCGSTSGCS